MDMISSTISKNVVLIKTNLLNRDPRLKKEINTLKNNGYSIILLCWDRDCTTYSNQSECKNYREIRLRLKAPYGISILSYLPIWWCFELFWLLKLNYILIHAINYDSIAPAIIIGKLRNKPIIYEMYDLFEDDLIMPRLLRNLCVYIDKIFMQYSDAIIIVDEMRIKELNGIPNDTILIIYNSPIDIAPSTLDRKLETPFRIFYAGSLNKYRSLENVILAIRNLVDIELIIAGYGELAEDIRKISQENPSAIHFLGEIEYNDVLKQTFSADLLFSLYDPIIPLYKFASSNKLFEAMMCGKPILVSDKTSMADIVLKWDCGVVVDCNDVNSIRDAICKLKNDPKLCKKIGENGRKAYVNVYGWELMRARLLNAYNSIIKK